MCFIRACLICYVQPSALSRTNHSLHTRHLDSHAPEIILQWEDRDEFFCQENVVRTNCWNNKKIVDVISNLFQIISHLHTLDITHVIPCLWILIVRCLTTVKSMIISWTVLTMIRWDAVMSLQVQLSAAIRVKPCFLKASRRNWGFGSENKRERQIRIIVNSGGDW